MASSSPALCQHAQCDAFQFTICRHCQLFLCIRHLAEHQQQFPSDFQRLLDDARRQQAQLATFETRAPDSRLKFPSVLDYDINQYRQMNTYVQTKASVSIPQSVSLPTSEKFTDMRTNLARFTQTAAFLPVMEKLGSLLGEAETTINMNATSYDDESLFAAFGDHASSLLSTADINSSDVMNKLSRCPISTTKLDQNSSSYLTQQHSSIHHIKGTEEEDDLPETDANQTHNSLTVRELKTYKCDYCPLSSNTYGIEVHHQVRHIPCIRRSTSQISLFEHLKQYHYLNYAASMQVVRLVSSGDLDDHPSLFSSATQSSIVSILPSFFRAACPLTQQHVFGLGPMHGIRLCSPSAEQQDFALYDHFLAFHQLNRASAMKLVKAMMKNENSGQRILFRPDEQVLNETAYVSCPLSNYDAVLPHQERIPHTPCQSTVKLRYLTGHLRDVHHLNKVAAKRIASALRHEQSTGNGRSIGLFERDENILKAKKKKNASRFRPPTQLTKPVPPNHHLHHQHVASQQQHHHHHHPPPPPIW